MKIELTKIHPGLKPDHVPYSWRQAEHCTIKLPAKANLISKGDSSCADAYLSSNGRLYRVLHGRHTNSDSSEYAKRDASHKVWLSEQDEANLFPQVYKYDPDSGTLEMEYIAGTPLNEISINGVLTFQSAQNLLYLLDSTHERGLYHGDLSVLHHYILDQNNRIRLIDPCLIVHIDQSNPEYLYRQQDTDFDTARRLLQSFFHEHAFLPSRYGLQLGKLMRRQLVLNQIEHRLIENGVQPNRSDTVRPNLEELFLWFKDTHPYKYVLVRALRELVKSARLLEDKSIPIGKKNELQTLIERTKTRLITYGSVLIKNGHQSQKLALVLQDVEIDPDLYDSGFLHSNRIEKSTPLLPMEAPVLRMSAQNPTEEAAYLLNVREKLKFYEQNGYTVGYPSHPLITADRQSMVTADRPLLSPNQFRDIIINEIYNPEYYKTGESILEQERNKISSVLPALRSWSLCWGFRLFPEYYIALTAYGPGGTYDPETGKVIVFTREDGTFKRAKQSHTPVHEIVHLGIEEILVAKYGLTHWEKERVVDLLCKMKFGWILEGYEMQAAGNQRIDEFVTETSLSDLPRAIERYIKKYPREKTA